MGRLRLWLVNSMAWPSAEERSQRERELASTSGFFVSGGVGPEQIAELKKGFDERWDGPQALLVHHHLRQPVPAKPWYEENADLMAPLVGADEVLDLVRQAGVGLILHGHRHQYVPPFAPFSDVVILNSGSVTRQGWPKRARIVDMADDGDALRIWELVRYA